MTEKELLEVLGRLAPGDVPSSRSLARWAEAGALGASKVGRSHRWEYADDAPWEVLALRVLQGSTYFRQRTDPTGKLRRGRWALGDVSRARALALQVMRTGTLDALRGAGPWGMLALGWLAVRMAAQLGIPTDRVRLVVRERVRLDQGRLVPAGPVEFNVEPWERRGITITQEKVMVGD